jgi:hypothetical protein
MAGSGELEPTAALVMDWAKDLYRTGSASAFCSSLDLSAGQRMKRECDEVCPWYPEVMMNRKWFIRHLASGMVSAADGPCRVIIPAAGKSPLALELLDLHPDKIVEIVETDIAGMDEKRRIYDAVAPAAAGRIRCVHADLYDREGTRKAVDGAGQNDPDLPTFIVLEGISYYVPPAVMSRVISLFASKSRHNTVILDYLFPCRLVREDRRYISRGIWSIIHRDCNFRATITYSPEDMKDTLIGAGCDQVRHYPMHDMERLRTGGNRFFPSAADGWIQISTASI